MFKLKANPTFRAKVVIPIPGGGKQSIDFEFRHKTRTELKRFTEGAQGQADGAALHPIVAGWSGVTDESDQPVEYSRDALERLLDLFPSAAQAITAAYFEELAAARLGN